MRDDVTTMLDARTEVIAAYKARKAALLEAAQEDERTRRPIGAAHKRQAARILGICIVSEEVDSLPPGIFRNVGQQQDHDNREGAWPE
jgi:hypothetical protein